MERLSYDALRGAAYPGYLLEDAPERVLQFGEGNFLRAFVDYFVDVANEKTGFNAKVVVAQPIAQGLADMLNEQQGLYTLYLRGFENGERVNNKRVISCVSRCLNPYKEYDQLLACAHNPALEYIVSNTTEAGIVFDPACKPDDAPPSAFPAKLARFMLERYNAQKGAPGSGFTILSCELIDHNGDELKRCVKEYSRLWKLGQGFDEWLDRENLFCTTLVDRIVTGYPAAEADELNNENGYEDKLLVCGEVFGFWAIEGPERLAEKLPFQKSGLPVMVARDITPYKQRKVRILNGAHTAMVPAAYLSGLDIVRNCMEDSDISTFLKAALDEEIIPTLTLPKKELDEFAAAVLDRFKNPFIDHRLLSIALNTTAKWRARVLSSLKAYIAQYGALPQHITFSFAAYLALYNGQRLTENGMVCLRGDEEYIIKDDAPVLEFFMAHKDDRPEELARAVCAETSMWGEDLTQIKGFVPAVAQYLSDICSKGCREALRGLA